MGVGRFPRPLREVGAQAMPDVGLDITRHVESFCIVPVGAGVLPLRVPAVAVEVIINSHCAADEMDVTG